MTLVLDHVDKRFGKNVAAQAVSFTVPQASVFGLLGPNGAGKTTTIRMIVDILRPDAGQILWQGTAAHKIPRRDVGYMPEERGLYKEMTVGEHVRFFARVRGLSGAEADANTERWLERMALAEHRDAKVQELSKGNQQKVQLASAAVHEPALLILDEPFSGLDPINDELLRELLAELRAAGTTLVLSTHDLERVEDLCDHVALIARGEVAFAGPIGELRARHAALTRVRVEVEGDADGLVAALPRADVLARENDIVRLEVALDGDRDRLLQTVMRFGTPRELTVVAPSMRTIFLAEVGPDGARAASDGDEEDAAR
jgi:ABC-2 type transport system ATP-binding protein